MLSADDNLLLHVSSMLSMEKLYSMLSVDNIIVLTYNTMLSADNTLLQKIVMR
jgi:hypothetical protein